MVQFSGVSIFSGSISDIKNLIVSDCLNDRIESFPRCISATSAHGIVEASLNSEFLKVLQKFYLNVPDGMPLVWFLKLRGQRNVSRCYGPDLMKCILIETRELRTSHFFIGASREVLNRTIATSKLKWGNFNVVGSYSPPFTSVSNYNWQEIANSVNLTSPDIIWVALGTPKQEVFSLSLSKCVKAKFIITVGAAFDFHAGSIRQAPKYLQNIGLEWFYRLCTEPRRLSVRYIKVVPFFLIIFFRSVIFKR